MTDRQLKYFLKRHPDLTDGFVLSLSEADALLRSAPLPSVAETLAAVKKRSPQYTEAQWAAFDREIAQNSGKKTAHAPGRGRRVRVAVVGFLIAAILFFTAFPVGRALAAGICRYIVEAFGGEIKITQRFPNAAGAPREATGLVEYRSIADFATRTGYQPFPIDADGLEIVGISGEYDPDFGQFLWIKYADSSGRRVHFKQDWWTSQEVYCSAENGSYQTVAIRDGNTLYYDFNSERGDFSGVVVLEDSVVSVGADTGFDLQFFLDMFD